MPEQDISAKELKDLLDKNKDNVEVIDVREPQEYEVVHIKGSKLIPMNELQSRIDEIDWNKDVVFLCRSGARSKMMANLASSDERKIKNLQYGIYECYKEGCGDNLEILKDKITGYF